jgi:hypothetical protein
VQVRDKRKRDGKEDRKGTERQLLSISYTFVLSIITTLACMPSTLSFRLYLPSLPLSHPDTSSFLSSIRHISSPSLSLSPVTLFIHFRSLIVSLNIPFVSFLFLPRLPSLLSLHYPSLSPGHQQPQYQIVDLILGHASMCRGINKMHSCICSGCDMWARTVQYVHSVRAICNL